LERVPETTALVVDVRAFRDEQLCNFGVDWAVVDRCDLERVVKSTTTSIRVCTVREEEFTISRWPWLAAAYKAVPWSSLSPVDAFRSAPVAISLLASSRLPSAAALYSRVALLGEVML
jgi:hypothetical protein